jgi:hypothetical protein
MASGEPRLGQHVVIEHQDDLAGRPLHARAAGGGVAAVGRQHRHEPVVLGGPVAQVLDRSVGGSVHHDDGLADRVVGQDRVHERRQAVGALVGRDDDRDLRCSWVGGHG